VLVLPAIVGREGLIMTDIRYTNIAEVSALNAYQLANIADVPCEGLEGERMLTTVRDRVVGFAGYISPDDWEREMVEGYAGMRHEISDGSPSVYTWQRWQQFADLSAWQEDISDFADGAEDMTNRAGIALYVIADRLALALSEMILEGIDEE